MGTERLELLVEGGKAAADQNTAQKLGPLGILQNVIKSVNDKTASFAGMKVPVKVSIDTTTKEFTITIGTPPIAELIKKELNLQKGSGTPDKQKIGNLSIESIIKIAKMKRDSMHVNTLKSAVKSTAGSANSLGVLIEGKQAREMLQRERENDAANHLKQTNIVFSPFANWCISSINVNQNLLIKVIIMLVNLKKK